MTTVTITQVLCPQCRGERFPTPCTRCQGSGRILHERRVLMTRRQGRELIEQMLRDG